LRISRPVCTLLKQENRLRELEQEVERVARQLRELERKQPPGGSPGHEIPPHY